jgi:hypothetical protein
MRGKGSPLEWSYRPPYMADGLEFPFEVGGPSSGSVTNLGRSPSIITEDPTILGPIGGDAAVI